MERLTVLVGGCRDRFLMRTPYRTLDRRRFGMRMVRMLLALRFFFAALCLSASNSQLFCCCCCCCCCCFTDERQLSRSEAFCLCKLSLQLIFVTLSWSTTIALSFLELAEKRLLWACVRFPSLRRGQPSAAALEARWTLCWTGWLS